MAKEPGSSTLEMYFFFISKYWWDMYHSEMQRYRVLAVSLRYEWALIFRFWHKEWVIRLLILAYTSPVFDVFLHSVTLNEFHIIFFYASVSGNNILQKGGRFCNCFKKHLWMPVVIKTKSAVYVLDYSAMPTWNFCFHSSVKDNTEIYRKIKAY